MREPGDFRLNPNFWGSLNSRYYYLKQLRKAIEEVISSYIKDKNIKKIGDFGCGNKPYLPIIEPYVETYLGLDLDINPNADLTIQPSGLVNIGDRHFDAIISTQVLEHVIEPKSYLQEAHRILANDGTLIITTHGYWMYHPDPTDYWRWTSSGLRKIIEESGFEIIHFKGIIGRSAMGLQLFQDGIIFKLPKYLKFIFSSFMQIFIYLFDQISSQSAKDKDACTYIVVARKK